MQRIDKAGCLNFSCQTVENYTIYSSCPEISVSYAISDW